VLMEHTAVVEDAVIGAPDPVAGEIVKAFVTLQPGRPGEDLRLDLLGFSRTRLGAEVAPRNHHVRPAPAQDEERQDHAPPAQGLAARGRPVDAGRDVVTESLL
jgi:acyl-CoA synthetase (AMP-forming)/AMP-acid ligase II